MDEHHPNRRHLIEADYTRMRLPHRYIESSFDAVIGEHRPTVELFLRQIEENIASGRGLLLFGPPSTGKSSIGAVIAKEAVRRGKTALFLNFAEFSADDRNAPFDDSHTMTQRAKDVDILVFDEIGFRALTNGERKRLEEVVRRRIDEMRATILTTNDPGESIGAVCGVEFLELVKDGLLILKVDGHNFREDSQKAISQNMLPSADGAR